MGATFLETPGGDAETLVGEAEGLCELFEKVKQHVIAEGFVIIGKEINTVAQSEESETMKDETIEIITGTKMESDCKFESKATA